MTRSLPAIAGLCLIGMAAPVSPAAATTAPASPKQADAARDAAIFKAAGLKKTRRGWESGCDDASAGSSYEAGKVESLRDLNGDGRPEALVTESSSYCYGNTGSAFWLVTQQADGGWKLVYNEVGIAEFLPAKGASGWPDISVGGPGFCFPVMRWNGLAYKLSRYAYDGKTCKP